MNSGEVEERIINDDYVDAQEVSTARIAKKKELVEQQRQLDLRRIIEEMRATEGIDPLQRFPKEIWVLIFNELDHKDKAQVWLAHRVFRDIMRKRRIGDILFPLILQVDTFMECIMSIGDDAQYWRLRCLSKNIKKSFDNVIDEKVKKMIDKVEAYNDDGRLTISQAVSLSLSFCLRDDRRYLKKLLLKYQDVRVKRFVRIFSVHFPGFHPELEDDEEHAQEVFKSFRRSVTSLLQIVGKQIWKLSLTFSGIWGIPSSSLDIYSTIQEIASLTPNLKWLSLDIQSLRQVFDAKCEDLCLLFLQHPFPKLHSLRRISFESLFSFNRKENKRLFTRPIHELVVKANQHVNILDFYAFDIDVEVPINDIGILPLDLIRSLPLTKFRPNVSEGFPGPHLKLQNIQRIINPGWLLQTITLSLHHFWMDAETKQESSINSLLHFLEQFPTLEDVNLNELDGFIFQKSDSFEYLKLPNLKTLKLTLTCPEIRLEGKIHAFFSLQWLLFCQKLSSLKWIMSGLQNGHLKHHLKEREDVKMLDFRSGMRNVYASNIWNAFPFLKYVLVEIVKGLDFLNKNCRHEYHRKMLPDLRNASCEQFMKSHQCKTKYYRYDRVCFLHDE